MAINTLTNPLQFSPSDNPLVVTFESDMYLQANFSFIIKTFFNAAQVAEDRVFPEIAGKAHYDMSPVVSSLMTNPKYTNAIWQEAGNTALCYITITENYGAVPIDMDVDTSNQTRVFKASLPVDEWLSFNALTQWKNLKFLTNFNRSDRFEVFRGCDFFLSQIIDGSKTLEIKLYNASNALLNTYINLQNFKIAQANTNSDILISSGGFTAPQIASASYYTVRIGTSEIITVYFKTVDCCNPNTITWLNQFGAFDQFIFEHNTEVSGAVTQRNYTKQFGTWVNDSFTFESSNSGEMRVNSTVTKQAVSYTGWITQSVQNWLVTLYGGAMFRIYTPTGMYSAINVTSSQFTYKNQRYEDLINESVAFSYANSHLTLTL